MAHTFHGTLRPCPDNPRYFTDDTGKAIYLSGSHTWATFSDMVPLWGEPKKEQLFDFDRWLDFSEAHGFNFLRMWSRSCGFGPTFDGKGMMQYYPSLYLEANPERGPGETPKYDLDKLNPAYFARLRDRVIRAGERGIYVSVMLFEAWITNPYRGTPFDGHPYNKNNNINGIDGDPETPPVPEELNPDGDRTMFKNCDTITVHTLADPAILALQKVYVKKVVETLNDLDNVLFEICNEALRRSKYWQYEMINYIHELERDMSKQHPVWMTHLVQAQNPALFASPAEVVSPGVESVGEDYCVDPPILDGRKVIIADTDHLGGIWGTSQWVWKSFMRGHNPIFMDNYCMPDERTHTDQTGGEGVVSQLFGRWQYALPDNWREPVRTAMAQTLAFAKEMDMNRTFPSRTISSSRYCLANAGREYLIYQPEAGQFQVDLTGARGPFAVSWFNPNTGETIPGASFSGGKPIDFTPPYLGEIVLHLKKV